MFNGMINGLDIFILSTFAAVVALGFFNGVTKVTAAILALYFGSVVAGAFYRPVTDAARDYMTTMSPRTGHLFFFIVLLALFTTIFTLLISKWLGNLKLPRRLEILDNVGGAALGLIVSALAVTLSAILLIVLIQALNQTFGAASGGAVGWIQGQVEDSAFVPLFLRLSPYFVRIVQPWFPGGMPPILSQGVEV